MLNNTSQQNLESKVNKDIASSIVSKINDLYIMTRSKHLSMYIESVTGKSKWSTILKWSLTDSNIKKHLFLSSTIGVFSGKYLTKFICFDIDSPSLAYSKHLHEILIHSLTEEFNVPYINLITSFSGKKGYHVELFFTEAISLDLAVSFHKVVINYVTNLIGTLEGEIEFRPTFTQGVKIPLSIHKETGNLCNFLDSETLEVINDPEYILSIEQLDVEIFKSKVLDSLSFDIIKNNFFTIENNTKAVETEELLQEVKPYTKSEAAYKDDIDKILVENSLLRNGTRNNVTFNLAIHFKNLGETSETTKNIINNVLLNTWENHRRLLGSDTTTEYMAYEVERITNLVYSKNYGKDTETKKSYRLYKSELLRILDIPTKPLRKLTYSMYIQSKKYAKQNGNFYMAYSVIAEMGNSGNASLILKHSLKLAELGFIEIVQRAKINSAMTYEINKGNPFSLTKLYDTNIYRVVFDDPDIEEPYITVNLDEDIDLVAAVVQLIPEKEAKEKLSRTQFYTEYKPEYKRVEETIMKCYAIPIFK